MGGGACAGARGMAAHGRHAGRLVWNSNLRFNLQITLTAAEDSYGMLGDQDPTRTGDGADAGGASGIFCLGIHFKICGRDG